MLKTLICTASFFALGLMASNAQTNSERYDKEMAKYSQTGTFEKCVRPSLIKQTRVLDDNHIIFEMRGNRVYLNTLDHKCSRLGFERSITYDVRGNKLCSLDVVSVFDTTLGAGPGCFLGEFELLEEIPKDND